MGPFFFPLPQTCTVLSNNPVAERSGQTSSNWQQVGIFNCLMFQATGSRFARDLVEYQNTAELYLPAGTSIKEGDRVTNVCDSKGNVLDTGVYEVQFIRRIVDFAGNLHHLSCKIVGVSV